MANIKNMEMAKALFSYQHITTGKAFLGLRTTVTYQPTQSPVKALQLEFAPEAGQRVNELVNTPTDKLEAVVQKLGKVATAPNGNVRLDLCMSADRQFAALQAFQFKDFSYHPLGAVRFCEGQEAEIITRPFL